MPTRSPTLSSAGCWGHPAGRCRCARSICEWAGDIATSGRAQTGTRWGRAERSRRSCGPPALSTQLFDEDWTGGETIVSTEIVEKDGKSTITTTVRYASREARDAALQTGMAQGMEAGYERLDDLLQETTHA